ncbi:glucosylglycerol-phosphate synthase [Sphingobacterium griseoflavum]|uniref:Alpha,alpha-trehalose-phosphate synthase n=1 Tax=Sphingobacterium griseoflavum TaxID=1474952 RepID=A0ABQ3HWP0_9SPHI|nr:glucosylglycerol-phosphate synthase [Sphingobacterium griseoflavum]GHE33632.1 alpha,alpha-trehalose-phosphate synthase [Sphingobacterium griseoflavum]
MMLLATDLDGTFLGGSMENRLRLYRLIKQHTHIQLVFVTGRGVESVIPLLNDPLIPRPNYIIADVGATVVNGLTLEPVASIQADIEARWPSTYAIREKVLEVAPVTFQEVPQQRRCSFFYDSDANLDAIYQVAESFDCDIITSVDKYLDVLPRGVNKGSTLKALVDHLHVDEDAVLVAGDTLNDLSLYRTGYKGVVVGQAEPGLIEQTAEDTHVYQAQEPGAGGILESFSHFPSFQKYADEVRKRKMLHLKKGSNQLVVVYHRLPFEQEVVNGKSIRVSPKSPNGIIPSLLGLFEKGRSGIWIGEEEQQKDRPEIPNELIDEERYPHLVASTISLPKEDIDKFYRVFSKEAFWPTIFSFVDKAKFNHDDWEHYLKINRIFAERIAKEADQDALVWIHEYNLWMVPAYLKALRPDLRIGFFHHTSFPAADIFNIIPWRKEIIGSLLLCDFISFHIPRYVENFIDVLRSHTPFKVVRKINAAKQFLTYSCALGVDQMTKLIEIDGRQIRLGAQPVGVNMEKVESILKKSDIRKKIESALVKKSEQEMSTILSVERLDYVKGPLEKIQAFGEFLEEYPEYRGKVELVNICTPPSQGMKIYDDIRDEVNRAVGAINGRFATMDWVPIQYFYRALPFEEVVSLYASSDIAWITPLRDGLNLVAKEYVAVQGIIGGDGALVLSEFAGASVELPYAILTNPYDTKSMKESLLKALLMPEDERAARIKRLYDQVKYYDIHYWGKDFVKELEKARKG